MPAPSLSPALELRAACGLAWIEPPLLAVLGAAALLLYLGLVRLGRRYPRWAPWIDVAVVVGVALVLRFAFLALYPEPGRAGDSWEYLHRTRLLVSGRADLWTDTRWHAWQTWIRPPGYYLFLAWVLGPFGGTPRTVAAVQAGLSGLTAGFVYLLARPLFGRRAALAAGLLAAFYPEAVTTASRVLTEPLYMALLVPALALLARVSKRPRSAPAAAAGVLFGLASLVRSAPLFYVPGAALLLCLAHPWRRAWRPAAVMVAATVVTVLPWIVRNSKIYGHPMGLDDLTVVNVLQVSPDERYVSAAGLDLSKPSEYRTYYNRLQRANRDRSLSREGGRILLRGLGRAAASPVATARTFGKNLTDYFAPFSDDFLGRIHREPGRCRTAFATDMLNLGLVLVLVLGGAGAILFGRDRRTWPVLFWFVFNALVINLLFHPEVKYRLPTLPVLMAFAGPVAVALVDRARGRRKAQSAPQSL